MINNNVQLLGNVGAINSLMNFGEDKYCKRFTLAVNNYYKKPKKEGEIVEPDWFNIVAWGKNAQRLDQYLTKGMKILINGHITISKYYDEKDKCDKQWFEITVEEFEFCSPKKEDEDDQDK